MSASPLQLLSSMSLFSLHTFFSHPLGRPIYMSEFRTLGPPGFFCGRVVVFFPWRTRSPLGPVPGCDRPAGFIPPPPPSPPPPPPPPAPPCPFLSLVAFFFGSSLPLLVCFGRFFFFFVLESVFFSPQITWWFFNIFGDATRPPPIRHSSSTSPVLCSFPVPLSGFPLQCVFEDEP